jgi:catechol 2,3-dioxygenase-like lactoylglutathione lyase family enzyme
VSDGLEIVLRPEQAGEIFRICFVVDDLEEGRARFAKRGVRILKEVNLPNIAH